MYPPRGLKGVEMGYIRERSLSDGSKRFYAEVELKGAGPRLTATFNRKSDAKLWIQKTESEMLCGRSQLVAESRKHVFRDAVQRYSNRTENLSRKKGSFTVVGKGVGTLLPQRHSSIINRRKETKAVN